VSESAEAPSRAAAPRRRRAKGRPFEVVLWRVRKGQGHGEHRVRVGNYRVEGFDQIWEVNHPGAGRYRVETRDASGTILRVRYANAPAPGLGAPRYTQGRHRPSQRKMPLPLPAWLPPPRLVSVRINDRHGAPTGKTRTERRHELPPPPPPDGRVWMLCIDGVWDVPEVGVAIPKGYKPMWFRDGRRVWVPCFGDGWMGFHKARTPQGELCFLPNAR
jgi:hypothetical protein